MSFDRLAEYALAAMALIFVVRMALIFERHTPKRPLQSQSPGNALLIARVLLGIVAGAACLAFHRWDWSLSLLLLIFPEVMVRWVLVPAGIPHVTYRFVRITRPQTTSDENQGGAVFEELRTRLRRGFALDSRRRDALAALLFQSADIRPGHPSAGVNPQEMRGATLAARGMLDALAGDWDSARSLLFVVRDMQPRHSPARVRAYCQSWLLAEAARRGAYHDVIRLAAFGSGSWRQAFLGGCAERLLGLASAPDGLVLLLAWLLTPARVRSFGFLRRALTSARRRPRLSAGTGVAAVTAQTAAFLALPPGATTRAELRVIARAWQMALEGEELQTAWLRRAAELGLDSDTATLRTKAEADVVVTLAELSRNGIPGRADREEGDEPALWVASQDLLQERWLSELEPLVRELPRGKSGRSQPLEQHWRRWAEIRRIARALLEALPDRSGSLFDAVGGPLLNHACWLHEREHATLLAHDVFRWLLPLSRPHSEERKILEFNLRLTLSA